MPRTILLPQDSPILRDPSTRLLNLYPSGAALVLTDAPVPEAGEPAELDASSGLRLPFDSGPEAEAARPHLGTKLATKAGRLISAYVEFIGPPDPRWLAGLREHRVTPVAYQPENSYLCYGPAAAFRKALQQVRTTTGERAIRSVTELTPDLKRRALNLGEAGESVVIVVIGTLESRDAILAQLKAVPGVEILKGAGNDVLDGGRLRIRARTHEEGQAALLRLPLVLAVEPFRVPVDEDEIAGLILAGLYDANNRPAGSYLRWLQDHGLNGQGTTIGIVDGGIDVSHPAFAGRARDLTGGQKDWHATMVAGHAAGNYLDETDTNRFVYGLGTAPGAALLSQDKMQPTTMLCRQTAVEAGAEGAIQNNSWGKETCNPMDYGSDEALFDALVRNADPQGPQPLPLTVCFSSGNSGSLGLTRPKAAKNVIVTGNSENFRPDVGGEGSDDIREVYSGAHGSSHGNCGDGRIRPHVVAPGEWTASANFDCHPGEDEYISPRLTWGGGSSGASPKTAGACALLTQWWRRNNGGRSPSPAMLRALIVNGAEPMATGGPIPNNRQGWGRLNVQNILNPSVSRILVDQTIFLSHPTEVREWRIRAADPTRPVRITLAWTDPPGAIGSGGSPNLSPLTNRLVLRTEIGSEVFRGVQDRFRGGFSASDTTLAKAGEKPVFAEGSDNLQNIFLAPATVTGPMRVTVTALHVTMDCLTGAPDSPRQDFALVISNGQFDTAASSSDVVVAVDGMANEPPPLVDGKEFWSDAPDNDDHGLLHGAVASGTAAAPVYDADTDAVASPDSMADPTASSWGYDPWWADEEAPTSDAETNTCIPAAAPIDHAEFARKLDAGLNLLAATDHRPLTASLSEVGDAPPRSTTAVDLSEAVAKLNARFEVGPGGSDACLLSAVLVVGAGTRVTIADIAGLRALASAGKLFLVSASPEILAFLAQRIGKEVGIQYRLAREPRELPDLVLDTLAEAAGLQPIVMAAAPEASSPAGIVRTYRFGVAVADRTVFLQLHVPQATPQEVRLIRPGVPDLVWTLDGNVTTTNAGLSLVYENGLLWFCQAEADRMAGTWSLQVTAGGSGALAGSVRGWALGGPGIAVSEGVIVAGEAGRQDERQLVRISADPGISLLQASFAAPRTAGHAGVPAGEAAREVMVRVRPSRLDRQAQPAAADQQRAMPVAVLGRMVLVPRSPIGATVLDLPIEVLGTDSQGNHFARRVHMNLVRLRPWSEWRTEVVAAARKAVYVRGRIREMSLRNGVVVSLLLSRGSREWKVQVASPTLGKLLAELDDTELRDRSFEFCVRGRELRSIFRPLRMNAVSLLPDDRGIEEAVRETAVPRAEADTTDYPGATRFVPAASFGPGGPDRTIRRVIIHITDGGPSIEGPISWFQNPVSGVSAHYIVGQNGEIVQLVRDRDIAWHAHSANADSIGVEHCARAPGARGLSDLGMMPTPLQYAASATLVAWLCGQYGIPMDREHILGHAEADPRTSHRGCPNAVWDWDHYMEMLTTGMSRPPESETIPRRKQQHPGSLVHV
ncbi:S8 family serine peptidase [Azospirillum sp. A1-3]|uniref:S8 family serine peptidase n=1 Tax=Azospirillum sp. A1-3 TaxID=185874 RepID=UPI0020771D19|nr:S8 family serine peptidase [Azospirillum sp. A1-3]MCM8738823.1 S8 family serine peptidase [Azospirillum sp. A1-3]